MSDKCHYLFMNERYVDPADLPDEFSRIDTELVVLANRERIGDSIAEAEAVIVSREPMTTLDDLPEMGGDDSYRSGPQ